MTFYLLVQQMKIKIVSNTSFNTKGIFQVQLYLYPTGNSSSITEYSYNKRTLLFQLLIKMLLNNLGATVLGFGLFVFVGEAWGNGIVFTLL